MQMRVQQTHVERFFSSVVTSVTLAPNELPRGFSLILKPPHAFFYSGMHLPHCGSAKPLIYCAHMPEGERKSYSSAWNERERLNDMAWLNNNLDVFWSVIQGAYEEVGRGAIVADVSVDLGNGSHPFIYCPQEIIVAIGDNDGIRMVEQYEPNWQFVAMLFKPQGRISTYRIGVYDPAM